MLFLFYIMVLAGAQQHIDWLRGFQRYDLLKSKKRVKMGGCEQTNTPSAKKGRNQIVAVQEESWEAKKGKKNASASRCNS